MKISLYVDSPAMPMLAICDSVIRTRSMVFEPEMAPLSGGLLPVMQSIIVGLPALFGPMMQRVAVVSTASDRAVSVVAVERDDAEIEDRRGRRRRRAEMAKIACFHPRAGLVQPAGHGAASCLIPLRASRVHRHRRTGRPRRDPGAAATSRRLGAALGRVAPLLAPRSRGFTPKRSAPSTRQHAVDVGARKIVTRTNSSPRKNNEYSGR